MKINGVRAFIIASLIIIILYILGLFIPIIKNTKNSKIQNTFKTKVVSIFNLKQGTYSE